MKNKLNIIMAICSVITVVLSIIALIRSNEAVKTVNKLEGQISINLKNSEGPTFVGCQSSGNGGDGYHIERKTK
jgi:hypothetical protein